MAKKSKKKASKITFVSPLGTFQYPKLTHPDTEGQYADGKFKTKLVVPPTAKGLQEFIAHLLASAKSLLPDSEEEELNLGYKVDDEGNYVFQFKSKFQPAIIDPSNKPVSIKKLGPDFRIGGGSKGRVAGVLFPYENKDGDGISLQMNQVQLTSVVAGRASMFEDEVEGDFDPSEFAGEVDAEAAANELGI
jgi:hypothetical protein